MDSLRIAVILSCALAQAPAQPPRASAAAASRPEAVIPGVGTATQAFAQDLWKKLAAGGDNLAFSPGSIALALSMTAAGARGATQQQMLAVLHLSKAESLAELAQLCARWSRPSGGKPDAKDGVRIAVANRLFADLRLEPERDFLKLVDETFKAPLERLDYAREPERARARINEWVLEKTEKRIPELLPAGSISTDTRLTLVNAVHFLGDWLRQFEGSATRDGDFTLVDGVKKSVKTMHVVADCEVAEIEGCQVVQLPYVGKEFAMLFVLPPKEAAAAAWLPQSVLAAAAELPSERVHLALPRFKIEMADSLRLKPVLIELGMPLAFDRANADFTGIANPRDPRERLSIDEVYHKAFVRVDEKGTEAAAATAVVMKRAGARPAQVRQVSFDRPFAFVLRHVASGVPLFVGRVADPTAGMGS